MPKKRDGSTRWEQHVAKYGSDVCYFCGKHGPTGRARWMPQLGFVLENIVPGCGSCSSSKGPRTPEQFREIIRRRDPKARVAEQLREVLASESSLARDLRKRGFDFARELDECVPEIVFFGERSFP